MILVTVGTSSFDPLIEEIDALVKEGIITDKVIVQIGEGRYEPSNVEYFRLAKSLDSLVDEASVIVTTGGAGTLFECLKKKKKIVAVENTEVSGSHQKELLYKLHKGNYIFWCRDMLKLPNYLKWYETNSLEIFNPKVLDFELVLLSLFAEDKKKPWWKVWKK